MRSSLFVTTFGWILAFAGLGAPQALALPLGTPDDGAARQLGPVSGDFELFDVDFTSIVALNNCSGSLVRFTTSAPSDKAMVLTNGHCFEGGFVPAGEAYVDRASSRSFRLLAGSDAHTLGTLRAERLIYATMTGTDMSLYRLSTTYADIESSYGVQALTISDHRPAAGAPIRIVSGYWRRIYSCGIDDFVHELREDTWTFKDSIRYSQPGCATIGGTSGSPIVHADSREVIGINNTGNESGGRCTMNNPCEVDADGHITATRGASYGQQLFWIYDCLSDTNALDLNRADCRLTKPSRG